jgi:hypothetical protein
MRKVPAPKVVTALEASESPLPPQIREALGELVGQRGRACSRSASVSASGSCRS